MHQLVPWRAVVRVLLALALCTCAVHARPPPGSMSTAAVPAPEDPCVAASKPFPFLPTALACLKSFPFNLTVATSTIDTLLKVIPHYVFVDIARDSPEPRLPSKVLLKEGLESILAGALAGEYVTEYDFEQAVAALFRGLNDAHTLYTPSCFSNWRYTHGFVLMSVVEDGLRKIMVAPERYQVFSGLTPDHPKYAGWEVLEIDGMPAEDHIIDFAEHDVGLLKDLNARFNYALFNLFINGTGQEEVSYGEFFFRAVVPSSNTITFLFSNGTSTEEVSVAYRAYYVGDTPFATQEDYFQTNCQVPTASDAGSASARRSLIASSANAPAAPNPSPDPNVVFLSQGDISSALLLQENVGIITIPNVDPDANDPTAKYEIFISAFNASVNELKARNVTRVILDMTQNGGGIIDLANWLVNALFPGNVEILPTRFRANPLAAAAVEIANYTGTTNSSFHWARWARDVDNALFTSLSDGFFFPTVNITSGNVTSEWSQLFKDPAPADIFSSPDIVSPFGDAPPFAAEDILILTNGFCGSSCSIIASSLSQLHNVSTVTVGGIPEQPQQISNFPGSQVLHFGVFRAELENLGLGNDPLAPQPFLRQADFSFTWRALYGPISADTPLEFVFEPSTYNLEYSEATATSMGALWAQVATQFSQN